MSVTFTITKTTRFETTSCCSCAGDIALPEFHLKALRKNGQSMWCPYCGTRQSWKETEADRLRTKVEHLENEMKWADNKRRDQTGQRHKQQSKEKETNSMELTATNLKTALWETLTSVKDGSMQPSQADAVAAQAREILRTVKTQLQVSQQSKRSVPADLITFSEK